MDKRRKFQGVLNIISFNRHFYIYGLAILAAFIASSLLLEWPSIFYWLVITGFLYGMVMPLVISAYVYDFSGYYDLNWLKKEVENDNQPGLIVNINAGFDETSFLIQEKFPNADIRVFDFYNSKRHTEPAIKRARKVSNVYPNTTQIASDTIPLGDRSADIVFLLSAAHEIRSYHEKVQLLKECHRLCRPGGKVIMVEHLRDFPNFLAFSVGFTHFFPASVWKSSFKKAGFSIIKETKFTPFMSIFNCS